MTPLGRSVRAVVGLRTRSVRAAAAVAVFLLAACAPTFRRVTPTEVLRDADLGLAWARPANREAADFSEQLVVRGALEGGGRFYARLLVTNLAGADGRAQLSLTVHDGDGRRLAWSRKAPRGAWQAAEEGFAVTFDGAAGAGAARPDGAETRAARLAVGVGWARLAVDDPEAGLRLSLDLRGPTVALQPEGGAAHRGSQYYVTGVPVPRAALALSVEAGPGLWTETDAPEADAPEADAPDADASEATPQAAPPDGPWQADGIGYVEQRYGNIPPYELARRWYNLASLGDDVTLVFSASEAPSGPPEATSATGRAGETRGWLFAASDEGLLLYAPALEVRAEGFAPDSETAYDLPEMVRITAPELGLRGVFALGPLSARTDDLASLSKLERLVVRRFMQPWTFRFHGARWLLRQQRDAEAARDLRGGGTFLFQQVRP